MNAAPSKTFTDQMANIGGYDDGYDACPCFWGAEPSSLVRQLVEASENVARWRVLDAGCGEGKNAVYLARAGAHVRGVDVSASAIRNARGAWPDDKSVNWEIGDIRSIEYPAAAYDLVIAYGLLHCLPDEVSIRRVVGILQTASRPGGYNVICTFNNRAQDLRAHPGFRPTLLPHQCFVDYYGSWDILHESDTDLYETHPHNQIPHTHSMTRLIVRKPLEK